ncbi:MAG: type II toxin-antitoxin system Phd/YefM family antitoxin [Armatimonadota bacterium]
MVYSIADAKRQFSDLVKRAAYRGETVTIGTRGRAEAALVSVEELQRLRNLELERDARLLEEAVRRSTDTIGVAEFLRAWKAAGAVAPSKVSADASRRPATRRAASKGRG